MKIVKIVSIVFLMSFIIILSGCGRQEIKNEQNETQNQNVKPLTQEEGYELISKLYDKASSIYTERLFEYDSTLENIVDNEGNSLSGYEILNYDEVVNSNFTKNGKEQYEKNNTLAYYNGKVYGNMVGYATDITLVKTEFIKLEISSDKIACTAREIYYDEENMQSRYQDESFVIKKENNSWKVESFNKVF